jgi:hypothetical protein
MEKVAHDFNGDGMSDIPWRDTTTDATGGYVAIWEMNGTQIINAANAYLANMPANWAVQLQLGE